MSRHLSHTSRRRRFRPALLIIPLIVACAVSLLVRSIPPARTPSPPEVILGVPVYERLAPPDSEGRPGERREIRYIVLHETGNPAAGADAQAHATLLSNGGEGTTSWHYTVDDGEIYHHIPDDEIAWHAGDARTPEGGNMCGIGVELCINRDGDFESTFENGAKLAAYLTLAYDLEVEDIRQHYDFSGKNCPQTIRANDRFGEFLSLVRDFRTQLEEEQANEP